MNLDVPWTYLRVAVQRFCDSYAGRRNYYIINMNVVQIRFNLRIAKLRMEIPVVRMSRP